MHKFDLMSTQPFRFKKFDIAQDQCGMKIGTDGVLLGAWAPIKNNPKHILDIGTGTGVIAIMLAQRTESANIVGVEIEEKSATQARENMSACVFQDRLSVHLGSIQDFAKESKKNFDLIISNPPFFTGGTFSQNQEKNNVRHTVKLPNGDLLRSAHQLLDKDGIFCVILPFIEGLRFKEMACQYGFHVSKITNVKGKKDKPIERLLIAFSKQEVDSIEEDELVIQHEKRNDFTDEYIKLTKDFYLNL